MQQLDHKNPWPDGIGGLVGLGELGEHRDKNGCITNLAEFPVGGVALITSEAGAVRSNHFHKEDAHYLFCIKGSWFYQECAPGEDINEAPRINVYAGDMVYTPPRRIHRCTFITNATLISISKLSRSHAEHEADVVRVA